MTMASIPGRVRSQVWRKAECSQRCTPLDGVTRRRQRRVLPNARSHGRVGRPCLLPVVIAPKLRLQWAGIAHYCISCCSLTPRVTPGSSPRRSRTTEFRKEESGIDGCARNRQSSWPRRNMPPRSPWSTLCRKPPRQIQGGRAPRQKRRPVQPRVPKGLRGLVTCPGLQLVQGACVSAGMPDRRGARLRVRFRTGSSSNRSVSKNESRNVPSRVLLACRRRSVASFTRRMRPLRGIPSHRR